VMRSTRCLARFTTTLQSAAIPPEVTTRALNLLTDAGGVDISARRQSLPGR
jgi:hypothetical protein